MLDRIAQLEKNLLRMKNLKLRISAEQELFEENFLDWALRYSLFATVQNVIHISCHLVSKHNLGTPSHYSDCLKFLSSNKILSLELSSRLQKAIGLRNLLAHEDLVIEDKQLISYLENTKDFEDFIVAIKTYI